MRLYYIKAKENQKESLSQLFFAYLAWKKTLGKCSTSIFKYLTDFYVESKIRPSLC